MKTKIFNLQKEVQKYERMLEENNMSHQLQKKPAADKNSILMITLKNKVKDMSQELKQKNQEIEFFKKNIKYTRFQELT